MTPERLTEIRQRIDDSFRAAYYRAGETPERIAYELGAQLACVRVEAETVDLLTEVDRLTAENRDLRAKLAAFADGRPVLHRDPEGPQP